MKEENRKIGNTHKWNIYLSSLSLKRGEEGQEKYWLCEVMCLGVTDDITRDRREWKKRKYTQIKIEQKEVFKSVKINEKQKISIVSLNFLSKVVMKYIVFIKRAIRPHLFACNMSALSTKEINLNRNWIEKKYEFIT